MLVIDFHARTKSLELADWMIENYLELTNEQDKASKIVLAYYLVEKAIIGAAVNIYMMKCEKLVGLFRRCFCTDE